MANLPLPVMLTIETTSTESPRIVWLSSSKIQQTKEVKVELLIIEQDATQAEIYDLAFGDDFKIFVVDNMRGALEILEFNDIKIVVSDWQIGEHKASIFCDQMDVNNAYATPVVVVVSDEQDDETIRDAFNAGVSHYITKPYNIISFTETITGIKSQLERVSKMAQDTADSREVAKTALSQAAIYGNGMEIIAALNNCSDLESMAKATLSTLQSHGIHCAVQYRDEVVTSFDTDLSPCDPTMEKVFEVLHDQGRIYRFGRRLMLNDEHVSLLVKHVAGDDPVLHDAILDMGAKLIPAMNARFISLLQQQALEQTHGQIDDVLEKLRDTIGVMANEKKRIVESVTQKIEESFHQLAMTEEQEAFFLKLIEQELTLDSENDGIEDIDVLLKALSSRLAQRLEATKIKEEAPVNDFLDVELF
ncbi:response regulator [Alteromonas sp. KUL49]|nr:response regulator [Alteromonas sp. KUL49]